MAESAHDENNIPKDFDRHEIMRMADEAIRKAQGHARIYFKFTCQHCGKRCTFSEPNKLYASGECYACNKTTQVQAAGFLLMLTSPGYEQEAIAADKVNESEWGSTQDTPKENQDG